MKHPLLPAHLKANITATYQSTSGRTVYQLKEYSTCHGEILLSGAPRVVTSQIKLPLKLVVKPVLPIKTASFKITVDTNKPPVNLNDIFPGMY
jgi:Bardet-Biedl syndrome 9 protein